MKIQMGIWAMVQRMDPAAHDGDGEVAVRRG